MAKLLRYHDPRAELILDKLERLEAKILPQDKFLQHQFLYGGLPPLEVELRFQVFCTRLRRWHEVQEKIYSYQLTQNISSIEWREIIFGAVSAVLPYPCDILKTATGDKEILIAAKPDVMKFVENWQGCFKIWRTHRDSWIEYDWIKFSSFCQNAEWLEVFVIDKISDVVLLNGERYQTPNIYISIYACFGSPDMIDDTEDPAGLRVEFQFNNSFPTI